MFYIAIDAGHYLETAGKRIPKELDAREVREWVLNNRVASFVAQAAKEYQDVSVFRVDDQTGKESVGLQERCDRANEKDADFYLSVHHNAGINGGSGGGIVAYSYQGSTKGSEKYRDAIYDACIKAGGLKGNRAKPKTTATFHVLKHTKMPAVLMEYGFMDSTTDVPEILKESYAKLVGYATMEGIAQIAGLKKLAGKGGSLSPPELKKGAKGQSVKAMQCLLIGYGFSCGEKGVDGSFGGATDSALRAYQRAKSMTVDGICGPKTWASLLGV